MYTRAVPFVLSGLLAACATSGIGFAQQVISAQSGTVHYSEGVVFVGQKPVDHKFGQFPSVKPGEELRTESGRAEILLTPGAFLRVDENSTVRMLANQLSDTRVEVVSGSAMVECDELLPDNALTLVYHGANIKVQKNGLYRLDADHAMFRVYDGQAVVQSETGPLTLKHGKETGLNSVPQAEHFDAKAEDAFYAWSKMRSGVLAYASVSAGQSLRTSGTTWTAGGWGFSPLLDEFTYLPYRGIAYSPFGWQFWSPFTMGYYAYIPPYYAVPYYGTAGAATSSGVARGNNGFTGRNGLPTRPSGSVPPSTSAGAQPAAGIGSRGNSGFAGVSHAGGGGFGGFSGGGFGGGGRAPATSAGGGGSGRSSK